MFRLPAKLIDAKAIRPYLYDDKWDSRHINLLPKGEYYLLDIEYDNYDLGDLKPLRDDILNGDYRALYLAWAKFAQPLDDEDEDDDEYDDDDDEVSDDPTAPPVPANLKRMTSALKAFAIFFDIDDDLIAAAQAVSPDQSASTMDYEKLLTKLSEAERLEWLARLLRSELRLDAHLKKRLEQFAPATAKPKAVKVSTADLKALSIEKEKERKMREAAEAKAAHSQRMKQLAPQEAALWKSVDFNLERQTGKSYDIATEALKDLKALAEFQGKSATFAQRLLELRKENSRRTAVISRWEKAGLFM